MFVGVSLVVWLVDEYDVGKVCGIFKLFFECCVFDDLLCLVLGWVMGLFVVLVSWD